MKQAINTRTQEEYDALMRYYKYSYSGWDINEGNTCVMLEFNQISVYSISFFKAKGIPVIPYTEFAANIVEEKACELGCKNFTGGEIKHHKDCVFYPESMSQMLDDYKALYLEGRELLQECRLQIEYLHGKFKATGTGINVLLKIDQFLTNHIDARGMGGTKKPEKIENLMAMCRKCHDELADRTELKPKLKEIHALRMKERGVKID